MKIGLAQQNRKLRVLSDVEKPSIGKVHPITLHEGPEVE
jgi:hypothetical protein